MDPNTQQKLHPVYARELRRIGRDLINRSKKAYDGEASDALSLAHHKLITAINAMLVEVEDLQDGAELERDRLK